MGIPKQHGESRTYRFSSRPKCPKVYRFLHFRQMISTYSETHITRVRSHTLPRRFRSLLHATENAGLGAGQQWGQSFNTVQEVPFKGGVEVKINGQGPCRFGLDTGASIAFWINQELARQLGLPVTSHTHLHGLRGSKDSDGSTPAVDVLRIDVLLLAGHSFQLKRSAT